jgi:hypothetical protein
MDYSGAQGTLIHEKKLKSKISCQTPFNDMLIVNSQPLLSLSSTHLQFGRLIVFAAEK